MRLVDADSVIDLFGISDRDIYAKETIEEAFCDGTLEIIEPEQQWIPVSERPPEKDDDYLVTFQLLWLKPIEVCHFENGVWDKGAYERVLAWMPLPESYRGEL